MSDVHFTEKAGFKKKVNVFNQVNRLLYIEGLVLNSLFLID